jgi:dihydroorotase
MNILIKSAVIIAPNNPLHRKKRDILIVDGIIENIAENIKNEKDTQEVRFPNLHVSLGWMDSSVSFGEPGYEERETIENGLKVAALNGFTAVALNPNSNPMTNDSGGVNFILRKGEKSATDVFPIGCYTKDANGSDMNELYDMKQNGAIAFYDFKKPIQNANLLKTGLLYLQSFDGLLMSFPLEASTAYGSKANESGYTLSLGFEGTPAMSEELQISRDLQILEYTEGRLHIPTISTERSVKLIRDAHKKGLNVSCSVSAHHLTLIDEELENFDTNYKLNPPLRSEKDIKALQKGVKDGTIALVTTDHQPIDIDNKKKEFSYAKHGTVGLESFFGAVHSVLDLDDFIETITINPRVIFKLPEPEIKKGAKANLTLFNPDVQRVFTEKDILSTCKNSAFLGKKLKGEVYGIVNKNQLVIKS